MIEFSVIFLKGLSYEAKNERNKVQRSENYPAAQWKSSDIFITKIITFTIVVLIVLLNLEDLNTEKYHMHLYGYSVYSL